MYDREKEESAGAILLLLGLFFAVPLVVAALTPQLNVSSSIDTNWIWIVGMLWVIVLLLGGTVLGTGKRGGVFSLVYVLLVMPFFFQMFVGVIRFCLFK